MNTNGKAASGIWNVKDLLLYNRWPWHVLFWIGYTIFRFGVYYITLKYYPRIFLEYMLIAEAMFVVVTYFTIWLYRRLFQRQKYFLYFLTGTMSWIAYLYGRTMFQFYYLKDAPGFKNNSFADMVLNNLVIVIVYFLFITACKYFKDGFIAQQFEAARKEEQLVAEVNNLKSQIAPHFLFNTLNNLYGLAVDKSDKLPDLMLRLSDLLRHSLYETQKPLVPLHEEINVLKSYIELESIRLENDLQLEFNNTVPAATKYQIAPLLLIVFVENAFKHAKFIQDGHVEIYFKMALEREWFSLEIANNYNRDKQSSGHGIGLINVKRRLDVLYPKHQLSINRTETFYSVELKLPLTESDVNN